MKVKKYVGETIQDAIFKVKADLGADAIILNTNKFKQGGFLGLFTKNMVEVVAGVEENYKNDAEQSNIALKEINDLKNMVHDMHKTWQNDKFLLDFPEELVEVYKHFSEQGVNDELNKEFIKLINDKGIDNSEQLMSQIKNGLKQYIGNCQTISVDDDQKIVAFVGPTGVGKTTTIAKLAAQFALDMGKEVCLITADTYRIAAVQQLQTYSDIINIPLHVVYNEKELVKLISIDLKNKYDLILIDSAGSSWNDGIQIGKLKKLLLNNPVNEIHLIISMNTRTQVINEIIDRFSQVKPDKLILTKLDETTIFGDIINIKNMCNLPYSYITIGQNVPDDIKPAEAEILTKYLIGDLNV